MADHDRRTDEIAVRELIDHQVMGWAAGSPEGYASVFTSDADYVTFLGSHYKGRAAIAASYALPFKKLLKGSRLDFEITQLRFLTPDVALVHAEGGGEGPTATESAQYSGKHHHRRAHRRPMATCRLSEHHASPARREDPAQVGLTNDAVACCGATNYRIALLSH
jgi:uncharacterized protein (TIGR02246 family)